MKLFETSWCEKFKYYERYYDTDLKKSTSNQISGNYEYFIPYSNGDFKLITDQSVRLTKLEGGSKDARDNYGITTPIYRNIRDKYWDKGDYNLSPKVMYLDIETRAINTPDPGNAPEQITLIQMLDNKSNTEIVLGLRPWEPEPDYPLEYPVKYILCKDEFDLLEAFLKIFKAIDPVIVYAWNGEGFDFPYLYNRLKKLGLDPNKLSNYGNTKLDSEENYSTHQTTFKLTTPGHHYLDMMVMYKKYVLKPMPSYSLDTISEAEVHCKKVDHSEFPTFDSFYTGEKYSIQETPFQDRIKEKIRQCYIKRKSLKENSKEYQENEKELQKAINFQFVYYGIRDVVLLKKIDEKRNITKITVNIAKMMGVLYNDVLATVKPWAQYISNVAHKEQIAMPQKTEPEAGESYEGAFVRDPVKGRHKWVMNFDVNSMYPQFSIAGFGMSPETLVPKAKLPPELRELILQYFTDRKDQEILDIPEEVYAKITPLLKKHNLALTANGTCYRKDLQGIIPRLTNEIYDGRKKDKKTMFKYEQRSVDIQKILSERLSEH